MKCYVLELKEVHGTTAHTDGKIATCHFLNATHNTLTYAAPCNGAFIKAVAIEAENIDDALCKFPMLEKIFGK